MCNSPPSSYFTIFSSISLHPNTPIPKAFSSINYIEKHTSIKMQFQIHHLPPLFFAIKDLFQWQAGQWAKPFSLQAPHLSFVSPFITLQLPPHSKHGTNLAPPHPSHPWRPAPVSTAARRSILRSFPISFSTTTSSAPPIYLLKIIKFVLSIGLNCRV